MSSRKCETKVLTSDSQARKLERRCPPSDHRRTPWRLPTVLLLNFSIPQANQHAESVFSRPSLTTLHERTNARIRSSYLTALRPVGPQIAYLPVAN